MENEQLDELIRLAEDEALSQAYGMSCAGLIEEWLIPEVMATLKEKILSSWGIHVHATFLD